MSISYGRSTVEDPVGACECDSRNVEMFSSVLTCYKRCTTISISKNTYYFATYRVLTSQRTLLLAFSQPRPWSVHFALCTFAVKNAILETWLISDLSYYKPCFFNLRIV